MSHVLSRNLLRQGRALRPTCAFVPVSTRYKTCLANLLLNSDQSSAKRYITKLSSTRQYSTTIASAIEGSADTNVLLSSSMKPAVTAPAAVEDQVQQSLLELEAPVLVDSPAAVATLVDALIGHPTEPPSLYLDLEGINLGREGGSISIIQIFVLPTSQTYLVDVHSLQGEAFSTTGEKHTEKSLGTILESSTIPKVLFDVRADSENLFRQFSIHLGGIHDLQLMELVARPAGRPRSFITGLGKCIKYDAEITFCERDKWEEVKQRGLGLFVPERGGSYEMFNERPLSEDLKQYAAQDVQFLPRLWSYYNAQISDEWRSRVLEESKARVAFFFHKPLVDDPESKHMVQSPEAWKDFEEFKVPEVRKYVSFPRRERRK